MSYRAQDGRRITDRATLARIRALAIPPAWTDVWICPDPCGHIQAHGRDARGRKQYRYHASWRRNRDTEKFSRLASFGRALPAIRRHVDRDLGGRGITRQKVIAAVVRLLDATSLRVGNRTYLRENGSFGLTTLRNRHVVVDGSRLRFRFRGKAGKILEAGVQDQRLARLVARCQELPGQDLFQYLDEDGEPRAIGSADVNAYLRDAARAEITAKDFRTWAGTLLAYRSLRGAAAERGTATTARAAVNDSVRVVADALGNTPAVSRQSYIAPTVVEAYLGDGLSNRDGDATHGSDPRPGPRRARPGTRAEELELVAFLESRPDATGPPRGTRRRSDGRALPGPAHPRPVQALRSPDGAQTD
jgi:DNA topoisomerase-1